MDINTPAQWVLIFYTYCFLGWCFETAYVSLLQRRFVNRGFIRGPMLPLYGSGAVMILFVALPLRGQPVALFFAGAIAATVLEYVTGWAMETLFKVKYWDYSEHRFQYKGRICLQSSVAWGVLSVLLISVIHPPIGAFVMGLPHFPAFLIASIISVLFAADLGYALRTALDLARVLEELTRLREQMGELREQLAEAAQETRERLTDAAAETRERMNETAQEMRERLTDAAAETREWMSETAQEMRERLTDAAEETRERLTETAQETRERLEARLSDLTERYEASISRLGRARRSLLRGNPSAVSSKFGDALRELKERYNRRKGE